MYHTEASQSTCNANQVTGFYIQFTWILIENKVTITDTCKPLIRSLFKSSVVLKIIKGWFFQACLYCLSTPSRLHETRNEKKKKKKFNYILFLSIRRRQLDLLLYGQSQELFRVGRLAK